MALPPPSAPSAEPLASSLSIQLGARKRRPGTAKAMDFTKVVAYVRVSKDDVEQALGKATQIDHLQRWAEKTGRTIVSLRAEEVSGGSDLKDRAVLLQCLADVRAHGAGLFVTTKLDRLARSVETYTHVMKYLTSHGVRLFLLDGMGNVAEDKEDTDFYAQANRMMTMVFAELERKIIGARTKDVLDYKRRQGEKLGGHAPYGFRKGPDGVHLVLDEENVAHLALAAALTRSGWSFRDVAREAVTLGLKDRKGGPPSERTVANMVAAYERLSAYVEGLPREEGALPEGEEASRLRKILALPGNLPSPGTASPSALPQPRAALRPRAKRHLLGDSSGALAMPSPLLPPG